jgi:hypothetical protein
MVLQGCQLTIIVTLLWRMFDVDQTWQVVETPHLCWKCVLLASAPSREIFSRKSPTSRIIEITIRVRRDFRCADAADATISSMRTAARMPIANLWQAQANAI